MYLQTLSFKSSTMEDALMISGLYSAVISSPYGTNVSLFRLNYSCKLNLQATLCDASVTDSSMLLLLIYSSCERWFSRVCVCVCVCVCLFEGYVVGWVSLPSAVLSIEFLRLLQSPFTGTRGLSRLEVPLVWEEEERGCFH